MPTSSRASPLLVLLVLLAAPVVPAVAEDEAPATDAEAREALTAFAKAWRKRDTASRVAAIEALAGVAHPTVADRLLKTAKKSDVVEIEIAAYEGLARQQPGEKKTVKKLEGLVVDEIEATDKRLRKGDLGFRLDPRTGDADVESEEGKEALAASEAHSRRVRALLAAYAALASEPPEKRPHRLAIFLQDPHDDLVVATLALLARWELRDALGDVLVLYRMYPDPHRWETGEVVQAGGTDATAKAEWMARFGHPGKQRERPAVVEALQGALETLTGAKQESPEDLEAWMKAKGLRVPR